MKWASILPAVGISVPPVSHVAIRTSGAAEIVLVDDSEDDEILSIRALRKAGIHAPVTTLRRGEQALEHFATRMLANVPPPQLLLLDLKLPGRNGLGVLRELRSSDYATALPVIILTGYGPDIGPPLGDYGRTVLVHKPLTADNIRRSFRQLDLNELFNVAA